MKTRLAAVLALAVTVPLAAQTGAPSSRGSAGALSLDQCLTLAAGQHPALAAAQAGASAARESVGEAQAPYYPSLDLNAGYHRWQRRAYLPSGLTIPGRTIPNNTKAAISTVPRPKICVIGK